MRILVVILVIVAFLTGCSTPSAVSLRPSMTQSESITSQLESASLTVPTYEVVRTYTVNVVGDSSRRDINALILVTYPKACVEIKNTSAVAGLFSVIFSFSEEFSGRDLLYLKPGETGLATYTAEMTEYYFAKRAEFSEKTSTWNYDITPVALR